MEASGEFSKNRFTFSTSSTDARFPAGVGRCCTVPWFSNFLINRWNALMWGTCLGLDWKYFRRNALLTFKTLLTSPNFKIINRHCSSVKELILFPQPQSKSWWFIWVYSITKNLIGYELCNIYINVQTSWYCGYGYFLFWSIRQVFIDDYNSDTTRGSPCKCALYNRPYQISLLFGWSTTEWLIFILSFSSNTRKSIFFFTGETPPKHNMLHTLVCI